MSHINRYSNSQPTPPPSHQIPGQFSVTAQGTCSAPKEQREQFIRECWTPFCASLEALKAKTQERTDQGYSVADRLPSQQELNALQQQCYQLTELWYGQGKGEYSILYKTLIEIHEIAKVAGFRFDDLSGVQKSPDGQVTMIPMTERSARVAGVLAERKALAPSEIRTSTQGKSGIDNTVLRTVFTQKEHLEHACFKGLNTTYFNFLRQREERILNLLDLQHATPAEVKERLSNLSESQLKALNISSSSYAFQELKASGRVIENVSQLPPHMKQASVSQAKEYAEGAYQELKEAKITKRFTELHSSDKTISLEAVRTQIEQEEKVWNDFVTFVDKNPGCFTEPSDAMLNAFLRDVADPETYGNRRDADALTPELRTQARQQMHCLMTIAGLWSGGVAVEPRTQVEQETPHRHLPISWVRQVPLQGTDRVLREAGQREVSGLRANEMPYQPHHGMAIPIGSFHERLPTVSTLGYDLNLPLDEKACLENWFLIDGEKIVQEYALLNPPLSSDHWLPGEAAFEVGQNPKAGSSIQKNQHTQISSNDISAYPTYLQQNHPVFAPSLQATVDVVQVGKEPDAFFLKIVTANPKSPEIVQFIDNLKTEYLKSFGGPTKIDFNIKCINNNDGTCTLIFTPICQLTVNGKEKGIDKSTNPFTEQTNIQMEIPVHCMDTAKGAGWFMVPEGNPELASWAMQGQQTIRHLYDFTRVPGARGIAEKAVAQASNGPSNPPLKTRV
ncbi:MAG: hypothetical protein KGZ39_04305 [Simkania sp.]|nr:hypothetical protein [Simkania sp.]